MKDSIRLFVAAILPPTLKEKLQEQVRQFEVPGLRLLPVQNLHLTLYFIGNVPLQQLASIKLRLAEIAGHHQPFTLQFEQTEPGPKPRHPRLIWARFAPDAAFEALSQELAQALSGQPATQQKAIPHVTLARFRKVTPPPKGLPALTLPEPPGLPVHELALWQSVIGSPHPVYHILERYPLG